MLGAEQRCEQLERKVEQLTQQVDLLLKSRRRSEAEHQKTIRKLERDVAERDEKLEEAWKLIAWFQRTFMGSDSEKISEEKGETESNGTKAQADELGEENKDSNRYGNQSQEASEFKRPRGQQRNSKGHGRTKQERPQDTETRALDIPGGCSCDKCGKPYLVLKQTQDSELAEMQLLVYWIAYQRKKYVSQCNCNGKRIRVAEPPAKLIPKSRIGNSLWVHLVVAKLLHGVPTSRTLQELSLCGFTLAQGTVTGGLKIINDLLEPLYEAIVNHCRGASLWNADETTWRVFDADKTRWWLWLVASNDAVAYLLDRSRSKKVPTEFFAGSSGTLMTDRLASYKGLHSGILKAWCWVHQRRDVYNIFKGVKKLKKWAKDWLDEITVLFTLNHKRFKAWQENKELPLAQKELEACIKKLKERWEQELREPKLHPQQKTVLLSFKRHWTGLCIFIHDPRIPMHNNRAERLLRNAVIIRKNSYGSGAEWSGHLAAKLFSLFQTWLINGLDPRALLQDYLDQCSKRGKAAKPPPDIGQFMPWTMSVERKQEFALPASYSRPG